MDGLANGSRERADLADNFNNGIRQNGRDGQGQQPSRWEQNTTHGSNNRPGVSGQRSYEYRGQQLSGGGSNTAEGSNNRPRQGQTGQLQQSSRGMQRDRGASSQDRRRNRHNTGRRQNDQRSEPARTSQSNPVGLPNQVSAADPRIQQGNLQGSMSAEPSTFEGTSSTQVLSSKDFHWFKVGRVFQMPVSSQIGFGDVPTTDEMQHDLRLSKTLFGHIYTKLAYFVVVGIDGRRCTCFPINTYDGYGLAKRSMTDTEARGHAVVYSRGSPPIDSRTERQPIQVNTFGPPGMDPMSRLNTLKLETIEMNLPVINVGMVIERDIPTLKGFAVEYHQYQLQQLLPNGAAGASSANNAREQYLT